MRIIIDVKIDHEAFDEYYAEYPGFRAEGEKPGDTLIREAIAAWESEGLISGPEEPTGRWEETPEATP